MNARTADKDDFVPLDFSTHMDVFPDDYTCDVSLPRANQDRCLNANGTLLLDSCKLSGLRIINGRVGKDSEFGKCTYVGSCGSSFIDYVIADQALFKYFTKFCVNCPNILSDHCELNLLWILICHVVIFMSKKAKIVQTLNVKGNMCGIKIRQTFFLKIYKLQMLRNS